MARHQTGDAVGALLYLTAVEERSYAEVASQLRIPISTVMSRKYQGRQMVLACLAEAPP